MAFRFPFARAFMARYGVNVAGFFWNAGTVLQFVFGLIASSPREIISAVFNVASPTSYMLFGQRQWGVALGGICGIIGTFLAVYPGLMNAEIGTIFGFAFFNVCVACNVFAVQLTRRFGESKNKFARALLGHPRRSSGLGAFTLTRLPIIYENAVHGRWPMALVFAVWALGDIALSFSKAE